MAANVETLNSSMSDTFDDEWIWLGEKWSRASDALNPNRVDMEEEEELNMEESSVSRRSTAMEWLLDPC